MRCPFSCFTLVSSAALLAVLLAAAAPVQAAAAPVQAAAAPVQAAAGDKVGHFPHVEFSVAKKQVRVECESLAVDAPLEFFVCSAGTSEHESVLRTRARPSDIHTALLAIGMKPGAPLTYNEPTKAWLPPHGPPLFATVEFQQDGKTVSYPAYRWIRDMKTKKEPRAFAWVFTGSRITKDGRYAADDTGYVMTLVNFDYALIDVPQLVSSSNDELEWERNAKLMPDKKGTTVWLVLEPAGGGAGAGAGAGGGAAPTTQQSALPAVPAGVASSPATTQPADSPAALEASVHTDDARVQALIRYHDQVIGPRADALRQAAQAHYEVISQLRKEQQRLIGEADLLQRTIDELEKKYADLTTPHPPDEAAPVTNEAAPALGIEGK